uniref:Uncharacterized protein n=1 Tax=Cacopsylla melanoneura TaxID=428564 RepID=A0A8D8ZWW6_9HEMI
MYNTMYELPVCTKCMHVSIIAFVFVYVQSMYYCLSDLSLWKLDVLSVMPLTWCGYQTRVYGYQTRVYGYQIRVYGYRTRGCVSSIPNQMSLVPYYVTPYAQNEHFTFFITYL